MRRYAGLAVLLALCLLVFGSAPAQAGGPTSVILTSYEPQAAAAALNGTADYAALERSIGEIDAGAIVENPPTRVPDYAISVTWLIHDNEAWRRDTVKIYGEAIYVSGFNLLDGTWPEQDPPLRMPSDPALLRVTLTRLGMLGDAPKPTSQPATASATPLAATPTGAVPPMGDADGAAAAPSTGGGSDGGGSMPWLLMVPVALAGVALGWLGGRRQATPSPRAA